MPSAKEDRPAGHRQIVRFSFYRVDSAWRALPPEERDSHKHQFCRAVESFGERLQVRSYSLAGTRGDADLLLWQIADRLDDLQSLATAVVKTEMAPYLSLPYSYLAMTRRSVYVSGEEGRARTVLHPTKSAYLFVYPFVKTRDWYQLPLDERQAMMDQHMAIGRKYPSVKLNTTYSFGLDDQEFVVSFETDEPADFLDLVMELREARSSLFTLRDSPAFTCIAMPLREALDAIGGVEQPLQTERYEAPSGASPGGASNGRPSTGSEPFLAAHVADVPEGGCALVYHEGEQIAIFNSGGRFFAVGNRCSHANGPLADGKLEGSTVVCSYHGSRFDLATGVPLSGPASRPLAAFNVIPEDGRIYLQRRAPQAAARGPATG